ncbi:MAG: AAA family ATPase [Bacteroidetes bacterium GWB2_41_8]|nr:MAG: AAA family ATPase [Bacteroidetes bacterium GWB2_41_8]
MNVIRTIQKPLADILKSNRKIVVLFGARQTGKTTLCNQVLADMTGKILKINGDEIKYSDLLSSRDFSKMKLLLEGFDILFIDEAQRIQDIGINLKIIYDNMPEMKVLITGSSSFELANQVKEPLTGRTSTLKMMPFSLQELQQSTTIFDIQQRLEEFMLFGLYPEITHYANSAEKEKYLNELSTSYLYKDVLELSNIRNSSKISSLLKLLAFQIGREVSLNEIGQSLGMSQETVSSYIDLLEKSFIVFRLSGFSRNLRKEIVKRDKIYFWDLGVRNCIVQNFAPLSSRTDVGEMWENLIVSERLKYLYNNQLTVNSYFWRTYTGAEVDYVEEKNGELFAYEIKYSKVKKNAPQTWIENYGNNFKCITRDNFWEFTM